jgi:hypothetical protein
MKKFAIPAFVAGAMMTSVLGATAIAAAAPSGSSSVDDTVRTLEASGYTVIVNRSGTAPSSSCTVASIQPGQTYSTVDSRGSSSPSETILSKTVRVDLAC